MEKTGRTGFILNDEFDWENVSDGVIRKILAYDKDIMSVVYKFRKGAVGSLHHHPHKQIGYLVSGSFEVTLSGEKKILKTGDSYFTLPEIEHGVTALEDSILIDVFTPCRMDLITNITQ